MNVIFFGTSDYCLPVLDTLHKNFDLRLVVTRPDKPIGRKKTLTSSATKIWATEHKIPTLTPETFKKDLPAGRHGTQNRNLLIRELDNLKIDLAVVSDYGLIIPAAIFNLPKNGTLNIHFSKLPDLRGPSPVQFTLLRGDTKSWITIFKLENPPELEIKMDSGPILFQKSYPIYPDDTTQTLYARLFQEAAKILPMTINDYLMTKSPLNPQDHSTATFTRFLTKDDGYIKWQLLQKAINGQNLPKNELPKIQQEALRLGPLAQGKPPSPKLTPINLINSVYSFYRAMTPWPSLWTLRQAQGKQQRMIIRKCHLEKNKLILDQVQFEGKKPQARLEN